LSFTIAHKQENEFNQRIIYTQIEHQNLWDKMLVLKGNEYLKVKGTTDTNIYYIVKKFYIMN